MLKAIPLLGLTLILAMVLVVVVNTATPVLAADTGFFDANGTIASNSVTNPDSGWTSDDLYASFNAVTDTADYGFANLGIPSGAVIDGIEVTIEGLRKGNSADINLDAALWSTSTSDPDAYTATKIAVLGNADQTLTLGGPDDKWETTWTVADFADETFKIRVGVRAFTKGHANLDAVQVKVYYTPTTTPTTLTVSTASGTYGGTCNLTATLTVTAGGAPIASEPVNFTLNAVLVPGGPYTTDALGVANVPAASLAGINAGTYGTGVGASFAGDATYDPSSGTNSLTVTRKAASVAPDANSKVYGDADPVFTGTLSGFLVADNVTATYSRVAGETVLGGPYTISAALSPDGVLSNYDIDYNTADFSITVKTASVTPDAASKVYGAADPVFTGTLTGFEAADNVTATYSRGAGETVAGSPYTISAVLSPAGVLGNYTITYNTANFTITPKAASVTPDAASKVYGAADPVFTGTLTGFEAADNVTATYSRTPGETVLGGPYTISAALSPDGVLSNYTITYNTASFDITPLTITVTADAKTKVYGAADPALTYTLSPALVGSDTFTGALSRAAGENVGTYAINQGTLALSSNYTLNYVGANLTITPKALTVTANNRTKIYGATVTFAGTEFAAGGLVNADTVTGVTLTSAGAAASAAVVGSPYYSIVPSAAVGTGLGNYTISYVNGSLTLSKASIDLSMSSSLTTAVRGREVTFTATVTGTGATGTVTFKDGETVLGSSTLSNGTATYATSTLAAGTHDITAVYGGDANFAGNTSSAVPLTVKTPSGVNWALIGAIIAAVVLFGLFFFLLFMRRKKKPNQPQAPTPTPSRT